MPKTTTLYLPDGTVLRREWEEGTRPSLKWLQRAVQGLIAPVDAYIAMVPEDETQPYTTAYANDEGLLRGMDLNPKGTRAVKWYEPLVGPVVVLEGWSYEDISEGLSEAVNPDDLGTQV
jgi:hypothetical protein